MAIVGDAYVVVRAVTTGVEDDIARAFSGARGIGADAGEDSGSAFAQSFRDSSSRGGGGFTKFQKEAEQARVRFNKLIRISYALGPAISGVVGAIGSLATGLFLVGAAAGQTIPALIVIPSILGAILQSAIALKLAFKGVGNAIKLGLKPAKDASDAADKAIRDAEQGVQKAKENLARTQTRQAESLTDAEDRLRESKQELVDLEKESAEAQKAVTQAYIDGKRALEELAFSAEDAALKQEGAGISLEKARESLARVQDLPPNSRARREAELAFKEAELAFRRTTDTNKKLQADNEKAQLAGVEGTKEVVDAKKEAATLEERIAKKKADLQREEMMNLRMLRDQAWELKDAQDGVRDAEERLADAIKTSKKQTDEYAAALKQLPPAAQEFVKYIVSLKPLFKELNTIAATEFFTPFTRGLKNLVTAGEATFKKIVGDTAGALGRAGESLLNFLATSRQLENFELISDTNVFVIEKFGKITENLIGLFSELLIAADPLIRRFFTWVETLTRGWKETAEINRETGKLTETFDKAGDRLSTFGDIFGGIFGGLKALTVPASDAIDKVLKSLKDSAEAFEKYAKGPENQATLKKFFDDSAENFIQLGSLLKEIVKGFLILGADPNLGKFLSALKPVVVEFTKAGQESLKAGPAFAGFLTEFAKFVRLTTESGAIQLFFNILKGVLGVLNDVLGSEIGKKIFEFTGKFKAITLALGLIITAAAFFGKAVAGSILFVIGKIQALGRIIGFIAGKRPFDSITKSSGLTRTELKKQLIVDAQKKTAMDAVGTAGQRAATGIRATGTASAGAIVPLQKATVASRVKATALAGLGRAGTIAGRGIGAVGRGLALLGGPIGIILLLLPLIISNWDKIKEAIGKFIGWLKENWPLVLAILTGPIGLAILAIIKNWDTITEFFKALPGKLAELAGKLWDWIVDKFKAIVALYITAWTAVFDFIKGLPAKLLEIGGKIWDWVVDKFKAAVGLLKTAATAIFDFIRELPGKLLEIGKNLWNWIGDKLGSAIDALKTQFNNLVEWVKGLPGRIASASGKLWDGFKNSFKDALNYIINKWNSFRIEARFPPDFIVPFLRNKGFTLDTPNIPTLAEGGVVRPTPGGTLARIGEAGRPERIEPLDEEGLSKRDRALVTLLSGGQGSGATINVYPSEGMDESELAALVSRQIAFQMRRGGV